MPDIPPEIWATIVQYIPGHTLWFARTVNRAFLQAALDDRYGKFSVFEWDLDHDGGWAKTLQRWKRLRALNLGRHVRSVIVNPGFLDRYFTHLQHSHSFDPPPSSDRSWRSSIPIFRRLRKDSSSSSGVEGKNDQHGNPKPFQSYRDTLTDTLACFSCVTKYTVLWQDYGSFQSVLAVSHIWLSFGSHLQILDWESPLEPFHLVLLETPTTHFPALRKLRLKLHRPATQCESDQERLHTSVAMFINRHCSTIQSLSLQLVTPLSPPIDVTSLLAAIGPFPLLRHLTLDFGITSGKYIQISTPAVLVRFMANHITALRVLSVKFYGVDQDDTSYFHEADDILKSAFTMTVGNLVKFETYHDVYALSNATSFKSVILGTIGRFSDMLTTVIVDTYSDKASLTYDEVETLVSSFFHRPADAGLKTLSLTVDELTPELVDLLAFALPGLYQLRLSVGLIRTRRADPKYFKICRKCIYQQTYGGHAGGSEPDAVFTLDAFRTEMEKRTYPRWALRSIDVRQTEYPPYQCYVAAKVIADCIPYASDMIVRGFTFEPDRWTGLVDF